MVLQAEIARQKENSRLKYTDGINPLVSELNIDKLNSSVNSSVIVKFALSYCEMPTELFRR